MRAIIHIVGAAILSNVDCVFLASMLNRTFVLLEIFSHYLATISSEVYLEPCQT